MAWSPGPGLAVRVGAEARCIVKRGAVVERFSLTCAAEQHQQVFLLVFPSIIQMSERNVHLSADI